MRSKAGARIKQLVAKDKALEEEVAALREQAEMNASKLGSMQSALEVMQDETKVGGRVRARSSGCAFLLRFAPAACVLARGELAVACARCLPRFAPFCPHGLPRLALSTGLARLAERFCALEGPDLHRFSFDFASARAC